MNIEDLKSGMAFETELANFYVVSQLSIDGENHMVALFVNNRNSMDWSMLSNVPNLSIKKVYEPVQTIAGWKLIWEYQEPSFTKADLKSGMRVITRNGKEEYIVMLNTPKDVLLCVDGGWDELDNYADDLLHEEFEHLDIVKVFQINGESKFLTRLSSISLENKVLLWERKE